jgi:hypothetical protein
VGFPIVGDVNKMTEFHLSRLGGALPPPRPPLKT